MSPSGSFAGFSGSLTVNMDKFREQMTQEDKFGKHKIVLTSGGMDMPEPIGLKLVPVYEALNKNFYQLAGAGSGSPCKHTESLLRSRKDNLVQILKEYPRLKGTNVPIGK